MQYLVLFFSLSSPWGQPSPRAESTAAAETAQIAEISFSGVPWMPSDLLLARLRIHPGEMYRPDLIAAALRNLLAWDRIARVSPPRLTLLPGRRVALHFEVEARPEVRRVIFYGLVKLLEEDLAGGLRLGPGSLLNPVDLEKDREEVLARCHAEGFLFASLEAEVHPDPGGGPGQNVEIAYRVEEGPRAALRSVDLSGNRALSSGRILEAMKLRPRRLFGLLSSGAYRPQELEADLERIRALYRQRGFLDARVSLGGVEYSADLHELALHLLVEEGPRYSLEAVRLRGHNPALQEGLERQIRTRPGGFYDGKLLEEDRLRLSSYYQRQTFRVPKIELRHRFHADPRDSRVTAVFDIDEREHAFAGKLEIQGNTWTRDRVLRSASTLFPAGPLTEEELQRTAGRIFAKGFFEKVEGAIHETAAAEGGGAEDFPPPPSLRPLYESGAIKDVELAVEEKERPGFWELGAGAMTGEGEFLAFRLHQSNFDLFDAPGGERGWRRPFSGGGQLLQLEAYPGTRLSQFLLHFEEPYLYNSYHALFVDGFLSNFLHRNYEETRWRAELGARRQWDEGRRFSTSLSWVVEAVEIDRVKDDAPAAVRDAGGTAFFSYPSTRWAFRQAAGNFYSGPAGFSADTRFDFSPQATGSETGFLRSVTRLDVYQPLNAWWNAALNAGGLGEPLPADSPDLLHILHLGGRFGWMDGLAGDEAPFFERFFLGGPQSFRGFNYRGLGPRESNTAVGGEVFWTATAEYSFPLVIRELRGLGLFDIGDLEPAPSKLSPGRARAAAGGGLQVRLELWGIPIPANFYWAEAIRREKEDRKRLFTFTLGFTF
ncbi:MAG: BamA/TamA family outer membrane protein [Planctomycetes bacterium]|nr:BamA/TamA family outer membrane protein [Planctomycetota bacterium]